MTVAASILIAAIAADVRGHDNPDYKSVEGIMRELYASVTRAPNMPSNWNRYRKLMLPGAVLLPTQSDLNGETRVMSVEQLIAWVESRRKLVIGTPRDRGFFERQTHLIVEQYGDLATAFSVYEEGRFSPEVVDRRGVNSFQLVRRSGRWYIFSVTWEEDIAAGPLPEKYAPRKANP